MASNAILQLEEHDAFEILESTYHAPFDDFDDIRETNILNSKRSAMMAVMQSF